MSDEKEMIKMLVPDVVVECLRCDSLMRGYDKTEFGDTASTYLLVCKGCRQRCELKALPDGGRHG